MSSSIIRSRATLTRTLDRHRCETIADGAVLQEDGIIQEVGTFADLSRRLPGTPVFGTGREIMVPGFVNAHHHVGLTPLQLGAPDMSLEPWFAARMVSRNLDLYLDTLFSAFEMIGSGTTTVQHIHGWVPGTLAQVEAAADEVLRAYADIGMRASYCFALRDQNRLVYGADEAFVAGLPPELRAPAQEWFSRTKMTLEDNLDLFKSLFSKHRGARRTRIQLAPANLHWCSDAALAALADTSQSYDVPLHMHLVETRYQKEYARRRGGGTALDYLERFGLLGPRLTLGHGVWLTEHDIARVADTGTCICHNCSSNFRLRSGIAPLNALEARGIPTAIGLDEAGINDDRDMLQEMRMVLNVHRIPGFDPDEVPGAGQVLRMATVGGARTTGFGDGIGTLEAGKAADLSLLDWDQIAYPYLDEETPLLDAVVQRAKTQGVTFVMCDGEPLYADGRFTRVDRPAALAALHEKLSHALSADEVHRRHLSKALMPHVRKFYENYMGDFEPEPFDGRNSRT